MFSFKIFSTLALAALAAAVNTVEFTTLDQATRTIQFSENPGSGAIEPITVVPGTPQTVTFPEGWVGNFIAQVEGQSLGGNGMLGEIAFNAWNGISYYDVSAIVNPTDVTGVHTIAPASGAGTVAGCDVFPCNMAYYQPNDLQTWTTTETAFLCTLGSNTATLTPEQSKREADGPHVAVGRDIFVKN